MAFVDDRGREGPTTVKGADMSDPKDPKGADIQGEGNYEATRRYDKAATDFVQSGKVDEAARRAQPKNEAEAEEMKKAEQEGKSHAKGEDPLLHQKQPPQAQTQQQKKP